MILGRCYKTLTERVAVVIVTALGRETVCVMQMWQVSVVGGSLLNFLFKNKKEEKTN